MPTNEFEENRNFLLPGQPAGIDEEAWRRFVDQHSPEVIKGYKMALADMLPKIESLWMSPGDSGKRKSALALHRYLRSILHFDSEFNSGNPGSDANMRPPNSM